MQQKFFVYKILNFLNKAGNYLILSKITRTITLSAIRGKLLESEREREKERAR